MSHRHDMTITESDPARSIYLWTCSGCPAADLEEHDPDITETTGTSIRVPLPDGLLPRLPKFTARDLEDVDGLPSLVDVIGPFDPTADLYALRTEEGGPLLSPFVIGDALEYVRNYRGDVARFMRIRAEAVTS